MESRVDLYARIRRDFRVEELSIRELSRRHGVARETVRAALLRAEPLPRKLPNQLKPVRNAVVISVRTAGTLPSHGQPEPRNDESERMNPAHDSRRPGLAVRPIPVQAARLFFGS